MTFLSFLKLADITQSNKPPSKPPAAEEEEKKKVIGKPEDAHVLPFAGLRYNIEIHLPATKDVEVFNAIFKSLKEHLIEP